MKTFLKLSLVSFASMIIGGCSSQAGNGGPSGGPAVDPGADPAMTDPAPGETPAPGTPAPGAKGPAGSIDFGAAPTGAAALDSMTCPALAMPPAALAGTVFVDVTATGAELGTKAAPFHSLVKGFGAAKAKGVVWVAAGTYQEELLVPNKDLVVLGGFAKGFASRTDACATRFEAPNNFAPVLAYGADVASFGLEGVTVAKGIHGLMALGDTMNHGSLTVARCVFANNGVKNAVGGALFIDNVTARIFGSVFQDNVATKGAAIAGSGDVTLTIDQNVILHNLGYSDHGGGLYISASHSTISRNTFRANATGVGINGGWGGAILVYSNSLTQVAHADFSFNVFTENVAGIGGAVFVDDGSVVTMSHDLLFRNRAYPENGSLRGAAIYVDGTGYPGGGSTFTAEYLTVVNNNYTDQGVLGTGSYGGNVYVEGYSHAKFTNSIFWGNGDHAFYVESGQNELIVENSIGASGCTSGSAQGLVVANTTECKVASSVFLPAAVYFGDEASDDYHEKSVNGRFSKGAWIKDTISSPAIDKADPSAAVDSEPMPNGARANLGAFSQTVEASKSP